MSMMNRWIHTWDEDCCVASVREKSRIAWKSKGWTLYKWNDLKSFLRLWFQLIYVVALRGVQNWTTQIEKLQIEPIQTKNRF